MGIVQHGRWREPVLVGLRSLNSVELLTWLCIHILTCSAVTGHGIVCDFDAFEELLVHLLLLHIVAWLMTL